MQTRSFAAALPFALAALLALPALPGPLGAGAVALAQAPRDAEATAAQLFEHARTLVERGRHELAHETLRRLREGHATTAFVNANRDAIEALDAEIRTALWPGRDSYRGEATLPRPGVVRLLYGFTDPLELTDFEACRTDKPRASDKGPEVASAGLTAKRQHGIVRHALDFPSAGPFRLELVGSGVGALTIALAGDDADGSGLRVELDASTRGIAVALLRGEATESSATAARVGSGKPGAWSVQLDVAEGRVEAKVQGDGYEAASVTGRADALAPPPAAKPAEEPAAPVDTGPRFRPGLAFPSGTVHVRSLILEGPVAPAALEGEGDTAADARSPLPKGTWIDLVPSGMKGWAARERDAFAAQGRTIVQVKDVGTLTCEELEGRVLNAYTLTFEVRTVVGADPEDPAGGRGGRGGAGARAARQPYVSIALPVGEDRLTLRVTPREMTFEGTDERHGGPLPFNTWETFTARLDARNLEVFLGSKRVLSVSRDLAQSRGGAGFVFTALRGARKTEIRNVKIRLDP